MYLKMLSPKVDGIRECYALAKDSAVAYPKKAPEITVLIDGVKFPMRVTGSRNWATSETAGRNGWIRLPAPDGGVYTCWLLFDVGFDPFAAPLAFALVEGTSPNPNPKRAPKNPMTEEERVSKYKAWALARTL